MIQHNFQINIPVLRCWFFLMMLSVLQYAKAQPPLETLLHLDKSFYVSGEIAWFKLYLPGTWQNREVAVNTRILNQPGEQVEQFFILTEGKSYLEGYFRIPYDVTSGYYEIRFSASAGAPTGEQMIGVFAIPVYNDLDRPEEIVTVEAFEKEDPVLLSEDLNFEFSLQEANVHSRDEVAVQVLITDKNGHPVSGHASVTIKDSRLARSITGAPEILVQPVSLTIDPKVLQPDIYARGRLTGSDNTPLQINVLGGYVSDDQRIYYTKSNHEGDFQLNLPPFTGRKKIQYLGFQYEQPDIRSSIESVQRVLEARNLIYTRELLEYFELSRLRKKIFQYYETAESEPDPEDIQVEVPVLEPDASYSVKEYESFKDMKSFFGELLTPLRFKLEKDSTFSATLFNARGGKRSNTVLRGKPLFFIDGKATRNADFVARLPISAIETVDLFLDGPKLRSYFQAIGVSGVVRISTSIANLKLPEADAGNIHTIYGIQSPADFPVPDAGVLSAKNQPFFRPQLYWNPGLLVNDAGTTSFSFYQSDDTGDFEIKLVFQANDGRRATGTFHYTVAF